jgi:hypothetical protein
MENKKIILLSGKDFYEEARKYEIGNMNYEMLFKKQSNIFIRKHNIYERRNFIRMETCAVSGFCLYFIETPTPISILTA